MNTTTELNFLAKARNSLRFYPCLIAFVASVTHSLVAAPPTVTSMQIDDGSAQRSVVRSLSFTFDQDVSASLGAGDLKVAFKADGAAVADAVPSWNAATRTATFSFQNLAGGSLPNGNFTATLVANGIVNSSGEALDGNRDGLAGGDSQTSVFRLFGDVDGDRDVDFLDAFRYRDLLSKANPTAQELRPFDSDGDGVLGAADRQAFEANYLSVLADVPSAPVLNVLSTETNLNTVTVTGTATPGASVTITNGGTQVTVIADVNGMFSADIPLVQNTLNALSVQVTGAGGGQSTPVPVTITQDSNPPVLTVEAPLTGTTTLSDSITVYGSVSDLLSGFDGLTVTIAVNGGTPLAASIDREIGTNGRFQIENLPLTLGQNSINIVARDRLGNSTTRTVTVQKLAGTAGIELISGDNQTGLRNTQLPQPLIVRVKDANGNPLSSKAVTFQVTRSDGELVAKDDLNAEPRVAQVFTDAQGNASIAMLLGSNSGTRNNWIEATSQDIPGSVIFQATAEPNPPSQITVGSGNNQRGETGGLAMEPLSAWVSDGLNGVPNVPVTFVVKRGNGLVRETVGSITVNTSATGHARVSYRFGPNGGNNLIEADFPQNLDDPAAFTLTGIQRNPAQPTTFIGLVLDNSNLPIGGALVTLERGGVSSLPVLSDKDGRFEVPNILPGAAKLKVVGANATSLGGVPLDQPGRYPKLIFNVTVVPNAANSLPIPVLLPTLNPANKVAYDGTKDVEIFVEGVEGVKFTVKAGSVTLHDGTRPSPQKPALLSVDQVHIDNLPMPLPDGTSSLFAWTFQPPEMHLDPPAAVELPNMNAVRAGAATNILSFDHATERFEIVANARVSEDGSTVASLPGEGIAISGWGGSCPPYSVGGPVTGPGATPPPDNEDPEEPTDDCPDAQKGSSNSNCPACPGTNNPVIIGTGEKTLTEVDLRIPGRGMDFVWQRSYRSRYDYDGPMGHNWEHNHNQRIAITETGDARSLNGEARVDYYTAGANGTFTSPPGFFNVLRKNPDGTLTLRDPSGMRTQFDTTGRMTARIDRNGNAIRYRYNAADRLDRITDTFGRHIEIVYDTLGRIDRIRDFIGREVVYTYNGFADLVQVRSPIVDGVSNGNNFPEGKTTRYAYLSGYEGNLAPLNHNLVSVTDPKGQEHLVNRYGTDPAAFDFDKVVLQQIGRRDQQLAFKYEELNPGLTPGPDVLKVRTTTTDPNGNVIVYNCNGVGHILEERRLTNRNVNAADPANFVTLRNYDGDALLESITYPEGNQEIFTYDTANPDRFQQRNILSITKTPGPRGGDQTALTTSFTYEPIYNLIASTTEARGNDTAYVPQNGGSRTKARYTTTSLFDYQEGNNLAALATETGFTTAEITQKLSAAGITLGLGDLNGDGATNQIRGNVIRTVSPSVRLIGGATQSIVTDHRYNRFGQKTAVIDPEGNVDLYQYHPENDPDGNGTVTSGGTFAADTGGYLAAMVRDAETSARRGTLPLEAIRTQRFYDPVGNVIRSIDGRGNDTLYEVNALNQIIRQSSELPFRFETIYFYDANDNVVKKEVQNVDTNGPNLDAFVPTEYEYNVLNHVTAKLEEVSTDVILTTRYGYDKNENLNSVSQPEGNIVTTVYDERDLVFSVTRGFGTADASTTTTTYDGSKNPKVITDAEDNNGDSLPETTIITYDGFDRRTAVLDAEGNRTTYAYDPAGNVVSEQAFGPNGGPSRLSNATTGNVLLSRKDCRFDELSRRFQCDDQLFSNIASVGPEGPLTPGDGFVTTQWEFDRSSRPVITRDDNNNPSAISYDGLDRPIRELDAVGNAVAYTYDDNSNPLTVTETDVSPEGTVPSESFVTTLTHDSMDRRTSVTDNLGNLTSYGYDSRNNRILTTDALGNTTSEVYDGLDRRLATVQDLRVGGTGAGAIDTSNPNNPDGRISRLAAWDGNSRLISETDDNGNATRYFYDALNRRTRETFADGLSKIYTYDRDDNLATFTDQNGSVCTHSYDGTYRLTRKDVTKAAGVLGFTLQTYEYDGLSRRTRATDNNDPNLTTDDSVVAFQYDSLSRLLTEIQNGKTIASRYDGVGRRLGLTYPDGRVVAQGHDNIDRVKSIADQGAATNIAEYDYLGMARVLERRDANGTRLTHHDGAGNQTGYDRMRREIQHRHFGSTGNLITGFSYAYDKVHNRRYENDLRVNSTDAYQYDSDYRLTRTGYEAPSSSIAAIANNNNTNADTAGLGTGNEQWRLDGVGNWENRSENGTPTSYTPNIMNEYDAVAGVAFAHDDNGNLQTDGSQTFFHDHLNRLVRIERSGTLVATYAYDAVGRRIAKFLPTEEVRFYHDVAHCIEERNAFDTTLRQFVYGIRIDEPIELKSGANRFYYHCNSIGSVYALTDAAGSVVERYDYQAYGKTTILAADGVTALPSSALGNSYTFTARRLDLESGLHYYRARYFSATLGRFIQRDPLGYVDGMGLYEYTNSNSINEIDPFGTDSIGRSIGEFIGGTVGGIVGVVGGGIIGGVAGGGSGTLVVPGVGTIGGGIAGVGIGGAVGGGLGYIAGRDLGGALGDLISDMANDAFNDDVDDTRAKEKSSERADYKRRCDESPPPGLDKCEKLKWELNRDRDCISMRKNFADKWYNGRYDETHQKYMDERTVAIGKKEAKIAKECCDE